MTHDRRQIDFAIEVFVRGHSAVRSRTHPYVVDRFGPVWVIRDAPRKKAGDYRKEEWIASGIAPAEVSSIARRHTRGHYFVCDLLPDGVADANLRKAYKALDYRLVATEGFFVHELAKLPRHKAVVQIKRVLDPELAARLGKMTRTRPIADELLVDTAPFRQFVALEGAEIVGRVRSVNACGATWCADMYVAPSHRRRGIGRTLLAHMLRDDARRGSRASVLTASHTGALLYPHLGYQSLGTLYMYVPRQPHADTPDNRES
jgi:GNAT superfamily N-acetyltransferase